jgi:DNA-directed RNA polymerase sigma subunit (sigma70/sigma32)
LAKEILDKNKELADYIKSKDENYGSLGSQEIKFIPQGGSDEYNPILETILHFENHIKKLSDKIKEIILQKEYTERLLSHLDTTERRIVELRYFSKDHSWYVVSMRIHFNERWCREINKKLLKKLEWWNENTAEKDRFIDVNCTQ